MSEPRPLSLGDLLRFDRERRTRDSSLNPDSPSPLQEKSALSSNNETLRDLNNQNRNILDSQIDLHLDSHTLSSNDIPNQEPMAIHQDFNLDSQTSAKFDSQNVSPPNIQRDSQFTETISVSKIDQQNLRSTKHKNLAIQDTGEMDSQRKRLDSQTLDLDSQRQAVMPDLDIKKAKSAKKRISKKPVEGKWSKYERNRDRSGERGEFFCRPRNAILKKAKHIMVEHELKTHEFFELAATMLCEYLDSQKGKSLDSLIATDNDRLMKTFICNARIINLYREVTGNRWTMTDDNVGVQFNELDFRIIEIAVIRTYIRWLKNPARKPIKWFKYFKEEIELHAEEMKTHSTNIIDIMATQARKLLELAKQGVEVDA